MKIAELASHAGTSIATIKFYLREGVVPAGSASSPNQHSYAGYHVLRVKLIRTLLHVARVPLDQIKRLLNPGAAAMTEMMGDTLHDLLITGAPNPNAAAELDILLTRMGWDTKHPARWAAASALTVMLNHGVPVTPRDLGRYAAAAAQFAETDRALYQAANPDERMEQVLIGTLVGNQLFAAFRLLAQEAQR